MLTLRFLFEPFLSSGFTGIFVYIDDAPIVASLRDKHLEKANLQQSVCLRTQKPNSKHGSAEVLAILRVISKNFEGNSLGLLTQNEFAVALSFTQYTLRCKLKLLSAFWQLQRSPHKWFLSIFVMHGSTDLPKETLAHCGYRTSDPASRL